MDNLFDLRPLPPADGVAEANSIWTKTEDGFPCKEFDEVDAWSEYLVKAYARQAQEDLIGRLAQMQEHEAIEWLLKARQDWWKS